MLRRSFKYRLYPTPEQEAKLRAFAGVTRMVYNLALEQRRDYWRQYRARTGGSLNFASQGREVTTLRQSVDFIGEVPSSALHRALRDLDQAYAAFFSGRAGYPGFRRKGENDAFRIQSKEAPRRKLNSKWGEVRVPNLGYVRYRASRQIRGVVASVTFSLVANKWYVSFACEIDHETPANDKPAIGIDRGIAVSLALSNGETFNLPDLAALDKRKRRAQRVLSRRKKGSNRRRKQLRRVALLSAKIARVRAHWQHCVSRNIAARFGTVVVENLRITNMSARGHGAQKRGLNRSILNQGWGAFATKLAYKLEERGGRLITVDPAYTSQTCSACGTVDAANRKSQAVFVCTGCGFTDNADRNAAEVILRRSTALMPVEGRGCAPDEAGTCLMAA